MQIEYDDGMLNLKCTGAQFNEQIESCKMMKMIYDPKTKMWTTSAGRFNEVIDEMSQYHIELSEFDKKEIKNYFDNLNELKKLTKRSDYRKYNQDLLLQKPIGNGNFQYNDIVRFINQNRALFAWSTGTGKSFALAGILTHLRHYGEINKAIILTSSIGILNLNEELKKFITNYDESRTLVVGSISKLKDRKIFTDDYDIIICGYDAFRMIGDAYDKALNNRQKKVKYRKSPLPLDEWFGDKKGIIFFDECHLLGNPNSLRSKFVLMNLKFFEYRYMFSATPADKEEKMYTELKILDRGLINGLDYYSWLGQYCELGTKWSRYGVNKDTWNYGKWTLLQDNLYKNYAVKRGKELLNLPIAYDVPLIKINMTPEHREIYEAFTYEIIQDVKNKNNYNHAGLIENLVNTFQFLQLSVDNPLCLLTTPSWDKFNDKLKKAVTNFNYEKSFSKLEALDDIIEYECNEQENKIIVFYYHPATCEELAKHLGNNTVVLSASIDKEERFEVIEKFKKNDKAKILIASILIANTSFTLTECKAEVFYERPWDYITYEQSRGRIYRVGQTEEVRYYNLCYNNSIDNLQLEALRTKGQVLNNLIKKNTLSPDEWKLVFNYNETDYSKLFS
jgi:SNF2 family DNA or RNA helicase